MPANYILLERVELNNSAASVIFANIPQTGYTDLKIVWSGRLTDASTATYCKLTFNGSATGFSAIRLFGSGSANGSGSLPQWSGTAPGANATSNTHSSVEINIPNYSGNANKSYSIHTVTENNATEAYAELGAGLWSNTAAINSITLTGNAGSFAQYSTFSLYGLAAVGTSPAIAPKATGGNVIDTDGTYWIHTFTSSGTFTPITSLTCDYLVVAGGGGGGGYIGGGGGAGGLRSTVSATGGGGSLESALSLTASTGYTVTVGAGGTGGTRSTYDATQGGNSSFSNIISIGGGFGAGAGAAPGGAGGSGGGGGYTAAPGTGTTNQGFAGGTRVGNDNDAANGGGGAGAAGTGYVASPGGAGGSGGNGVAVSITGTSTYYAGGGGGSFANSGGAIGPGGLGGGGIGGYGAGGGAGITYPTAGTPNTGGGGGGAGYNTGDSNANGKNGGSGIVIIRYPMA